MAKTAKGGSGSGGTVSGKRKKSSSYPSAIKASKPSSIKAYVPGTYASDYGQQIESALNSVINFKYDPMQDASYQALAKVYGARGNLAAKNTLADAAALNGGMQTSYAVSAAQQARNQYNQELAAMIPELEANAYNRAQTTYNALRDADETAYGRFRDTEGDRQWKYGMDYDAYRDRMSDYQFGLNYNYQRARDLTGDRQWQKEFAYQKARDKVADQQWAMEYALSKKGSSGGGSGGGGRRSSGSGGSYSSGYGSTGDTVDLYTQAQQEAKKKKAATNKVKQGTATGTMSKPIKTK